jgi:hypothetical protein
MSDHPVKNACVALASIVICILGLAAPVFGAGQYLQVECPPSSAAGELQLGVAHTLWIPDGVKTIRCVIVHQHGAGLTAAQYGASAAYELHWQALGEFATKSGHPELASVPWRLWGHSGGVWPAAWPNGNLSSATIRSVTGSGCKVRYGEKTFSLTLKPGQAKRLSVNLD